jgi:hypothetical protein
MPINVKFDRAGFYHPAYGRMGRGKQANQIYTLPDIFKTAGMLPSTAEIIEPEELPELLEELEQAKPIKPKVVDEAQLKVAERTAKAAATSQSRRKPTTPKSE